MPSLCSARDFGVCLLVLMSGAMEYTRQMQAPNLDSIVTVTTIFSLHKATLHIYNCLQTIWRVRRALGRANSDVVPYIH